MTDGALSPIPRSPLYEQVAERLQGFIEGEGLAPGDRLMSERDLATRLGVSRTSVRQALTALRVMGLVDVRHGDGVYLLKPPAEVVPSFAVELAQSEGDHPMIWEVREAIEVQAARLAARRRTPRDLASLNDALEVMRSSVQNGGDGIDGDRLFHRAIVEAARNTMLVRLVAEITEVMDRTSAASLTHAGRPARSLEQHRRVLEAIQGGDEALAAEAMRAHLVSSAESVASVVHTRRRLDQ